MGSKERYAEYFQTQPGVYFKSSGWIERGEGLDPLSHKALRKAGLGYSYEELVEKYGEENAKFLNAQLGDYTRNYGQLTCIEMGNRAGRPLRARHPRGSRPAQLAFREGGG